MTTTTKKYKISVSNIVKVPVEGSHIDDAGKAVKFKFSLICNRKTEKELTEVLTAGEVLTQDFITEVTTGWQEQRLVLEDDGTPAEFCADAFEAMLDIRGMTMVLFSAYLQAVGAKAKN